MRWPSSSVRHAAGDSELALVTRSCHMIPYVSRRRPAHARKQEKIHELAYPKAIVRNKTDYVTENPYQP